MTVIIVLNGTSSAGKTTLAHALQDTFERTFLDVSVDTILETLPARERERLQRGDELAGVPYDALVAAYFAFARELAAAGLSLIVECAITARRRAVQVVDAVSGHDVVLVGVECALDALERREAARGDRPHGLARLQSDSIHRWLRYDVVVDTETTTLATNVGAIRKVVEGGVRSGLAETMRSLRAET
jgi:chloramphenicol 3-O phosphotransferase